MKMEMALARAGALAQANINLCPVSCVSGVGGWAWSMGGRLA